MESDFKILTLTKCYYCDQMMRNEMGKACGTYGDRRSAYRFWLGGLRERDSFEDLDVGGKIF
jgi:hypothetical protein